MRFSHCSPVISHTLALASVGFILVTQASRDKTITRSFSLWIGLLLNPVLCSALPINTLVDDFLQGLHSLLFFLLLLIHLLDARVRLLLSFHFAVRLHLFPLLLGDLLPRLQVVLAAIQQRFGVGDEFVEQFIAGNTDPGEEADLETLQEFSRD